MITHSKNCARRTAPSMRSAHRIFTIFTLMFFVLSMMSPLLTPATFAQDATPAVGGEQTVAVEPAAEQPAAPVEEPVVPVVEEPAAPVLEEPVAPVVEEPVAPVSEEPVAPVVEEPVAPVVEEPVVPVVEEPADPVIQEPVAPVSEEPSAPAEEASVVGEEPVTPVQEPSVAVEEPAEEVPTDETASIDSVVNLNEVIVTDPAAVSCVESNATIPTIASDMADYPPGALVTLTGSDWVPDQEVRIFVDDDGVADAEMGQWSHSATVVADGAGNIFYQFNLADWFVLNYTVVARGECTTASTAFTDANSNTAIARTAGVSPSVYGDVVTFTATVTRQGGGSSAIQPSQGSVTFYVNGIASQVVNLTGANQVTWTTSALVVGTHQISAAYGGFGTGSDGFAGSTSGNLQQVVNARPIMVTADAKTKVYGDTDPNLTYQITSGSLVGSDNFTGSLSRVVGSNVGSYNITLGNLALSSNYTLTFTAAHLTITPRPITVTADGKTKVYGADDPALTYSNTNGSLVAGDTFTGALTRDAGQDVGSYNITQGNLALSSNYVLTFVDAQLTITPQPVSVTVEDLAVEYDGTGKSVTVSGAPTGVTVTITYDGKPGMPVNVGMYDVVATMTGNYTGSTEGTLTITPRTIEVAGENYNKVYGDPDPSFNGVASGVVEGDDVTVSYSRGNTSENVGDYLITAILEGTDVGNYIISEQTGTLTITPRSITVTANSQTKVFGTDDPELTYDITSGTLVAGDDFTGALTRVAGSDVGSYDILQGSLDLGPNYNMIYTNAQLTITPQPVSLTMEDVIVEYDGTAHGATVNGAPEDGVIVITYIGSEDLPVNAGSYAAVATISGNYSGSVEATLTITPRPITVTADAQTKVFGTDDPELTYNITSGTLVAGDDFTGALTRDAGEDVGEYDILQGSLALNDNYALIFVGAQLTITPQPVVLTVNDLTVEYDGTGKSVAVDGVPEDGNVTVLYDGSTDHPVDAGTYEVVATMSGNYSGSAEGTLRITPAAVTVTANSYIKVYGSSDPVLDGEVLGTVEGDAIAITYSRVPGENIGNYAITASVGENANYSVSVRDGNLEIAPAALRVTVNSAAKVYGTSDPLFSGEVEGTVEGDEITVNYSRVSGEDIGTYAITANLEGAANYDVEIVVGSLEITPATLTVTVEDKAKVYGAGDPLFTSLITGVVGTDEVNINYDREPGENVGEYAISATVTAGDNYTVVKTAGMLEVTPAALTVSVNSTVKVYGSDDPDFDGLVVGTVEGDQVAVSYIRVPGEDVGDYVITARVGENHNYSVTVLDGNLEIAPLEITVTADAQTINVGDTPVLTYAFAPTLVSGDSFAGTLELDRALAGAGTYNIVQGTLALSSNYTLTFNSAVLTAVAPAQTLCVSEIQSPFKLGTKNVVKYGSVVPVKIRVTDCITGAPVMDAAPTIQVYLMSPSTPDGTAINVLSSGSADSGNTLRHTGDGYYIFNVSTKSTSFSDSTASYKIVVTVDGKPVEGTIGLKK